ncbi:MAG TPA: PEGA domain-containing protein [Methanoregulaceae archaeon]|nr:PEGA domain-containing protein [Methanoregulaceae archaeon]HPD75588.1 PEGA domain-containing protein [Methanoregulaceae archaeon]
MHRWKAMFRIIPFCILILAVLAAGCSETESPVFTTGSILVSSTPSGAEIYLDNEYRGTTPSTISGVAAGSHMLELRQPGYERFVQPVEVTAEDAGIVSAVLTVIPETLPVTVVTTATPRAKTTVPQIHVNGYWTYSSTTVTQNPVPLLIHTEAFNVGTTDAREVTVNAMLSYQGRNLCWDKIYLGSLKAGGHVATDTMISCNLPSTLTSSDLTVRYQNVQVTQ